MRVFFFFFNACFAITLHLNSEVKIVSLEGQNTPRQRESFHSLLTGKKVPGRCNSEMLGHEKTIEVSKCWYFVQLTSKRKSSAYQLLSLVAYLWFATYTNSDFLSVEELFVLSTSVHITVLGQSSATPPCQLLWLTNCMTWMTLTLIFLVEDMSLISHGQHFQGMCTDNNEFIS